MAFGKIFRSKHMVTPPPTALCAALFLTSFWRTLPFKFTGAEEPGPCRELWPHDAHAHGLHVPLSQTPGRGPTSWDWVLRERTGDTAQKPHPLWSGCAEVWAG